VIMLVIKRSSWNTRCDHVRDRTILSGPSRPPSRSDVQGAHWS
jgi:hypothetical protein